MAVREGEAALLNASRWVGKSYPPGFCLRWVRERYGIDARYGSAAVAWRYAKDRRTSQPPPRGFPVFYLGGPGGFGHVAISAGGGWIYTTDLPTPGRVGRVSWIEPARQWGHTYAGWTYDLNGVSVWCRTVDLTNLRYAAKGHPMHARYGTWGVQWQLYRRGLLPLRGVSGWWGRSTTKAYAAWQRQIGVDEYEADGVPGMASLRRLGQYPSFLIVKR